MSKVDKPDPADNGKKSLSDKIHDFFHSASDFTKTDAGKTVLLSSFFTAIFIGTNYIIKSRFKDD